MAADQLSRLKLAAARQPVDRAPCICPGGIGSDAVQRFMKPFMGQFAFLRAQQAGNIPALQGKGPRKIASQKSVCTG